MLIAQSRIWRVKWVKSAGMIRLETPKGARAEDAPEVRELKIEVPLAKWGLVVKNCQSDRKLLGGILLDFAKHKERVGDAVGNDRLYLELQRVILDATLSLVEAGALTLTVAKD